MDLIDTHCHLNFDSFDSDRDEVVERAHKAGVSRMLSIGCTAVEAQKTVALTDQYDSVFTGIALHPAELEPSWEKSFETIATLATASKVVAIGETGLDFFRPENAPRADQITSFEKHIALAKNLQKPLIIHTRAAREETLEILKTLDGHPFVVHCFSEDWATAEKVFALGGMISFTGIATFPSAQEIQAVATKAPLGKIMVETDSPFLAPIPHRGKRCEPSFVADTAAFIAQLRGVSLQEFAAATTQNAERFFGF